MSPPAASPRRPAAPRDGRAGRLAARGSPVIPLRRAHAGRWRPRAARPLLPFAVLCPAGCGGRAWALGPHGRLSPGLRVHTGLGGHRQRPAAARTRRQNGLQGCARRGPGHPVGPEPSAWGRAAAEASALWKGSLRMLSRLMSPDDADTRAGGTGAGGGLGTVTLASLTPGPPPRFGGVRWAWHALGALGSNASCLTGKKEISFRHVLVPKAERQ